MTDSSIHPPGIGIDDIYDERRKDGLQIEKVVGLAEEGLWPIINQGMMCVHIISGNNWQLEAMMITTIIQVEKVVLRDELQGTDCTCMYLEHTSFHDPSFRTRRSHIE